MDLNLVEQTTLLFQENWFLPEFPILDRLLQIFLVLFLSSICQQNRYCFEWFKFILISNSSTLLSIFYKLIITMPILIHSVSDHIEPLKLDLKCFTSVFQLIFSLCKACINYLTYQKLFLIAIISSLGV